MSGEGFVVSILCAARGAAWTDQPPSAYVNLRVVARFFSGRYARVTVEQQSCQGILSLIQHVNVNLHDK